MAEGAGSYLVALLVALLIRHVVIGMWFNIWLWHLTFQYIMLTFD